MSRAVTIPVDGADLSALELGDGHPMIVLHGGPDFDDEYLRPDLEPLADLGRIVSYAQRGRGRSYGGEGPDDVSIDSDLADLDAVRAWTGEERVALIGHSFGAVLAMEYALRHPDRVSHLVLMNPGAACHADMVAMREHFAALRSPDQRARLAAIGADPRLREGDPNVEAEGYAIYFATAVHDPANLEVILGRLRRTFTPEAIVAARAIEDRLYGQTWAQDSWDLLPRLSTLRIPTLVIHGDHDFVPIDVARHIADAMPEARFVELAACGHFALLEQPEAVHDAIATFLA